MMSGLKCNSCKDSNTNSKRWNDSCVSTKKKKVHILMVKNGFTNRYIWACRYFNCKLKGTLFSSEVKELTALNAKSL